MNHMILNDSMTLRLYDKTIKDSTLYHVEFKIIKSGIFCENIFTSKKGAIKFYKSCWDELKIED